MGYPNLKDECDFGKYWLAYRAVNVTEELWDAILEGKEKLMQEEAEAIAAAINASDRIYGGGFTVPPITAEYLLSPEMQWANMENTEISKDKLLEMQAVVEKRLNTLPEYKRTKKHSPGEQNVLFGIRALLDGDGLTFASYRYLFRETNMAWSRLEEIAETRKKPRPRDITPYKPPERIVDGLAIAGLRTGKGMEQAEFAKRINVSRATLSHYEDGTKQPSKLTLKKIANVFGVTADSLYKATTTEDAPIEDSHARTAPEPPEDSPRELAGVLSAFGGTPPEGIVKPLNSIQKLIEWAQEAGQEDKDSKRDE